MAKAKTIYNTADGPRSVFNARGEAVVIPPGGSADVELANGEADDLHPDLSTTKPKPAEGEAPAPAPSPTADPQAHAIEELATDLAKGNTRDELLALAKAEKVTVESDDNLDQLALKIAQARLGENK